MMDEAQVQEEKIIAGIVGDYTWQQTRDFLVLGLLSCKDESEFLELMGKLYLGFGDAKQLAHMREKLGIKHFTESDLDKIEEVGNHGKEKEGSDC